MIFDITKDDKQNLILFTSMRRLMWGRGEINCIYMLLNRLISLSSLKLNVYDFFQGI